MTNPTTRTHIQRLTTNANTLGVKLPKKVLDLIAFDASLPTVPSTAADVIESITATVGDQKAYDKATAAGLRRISDAMAADKIRSRIADAAQDARWQAIRAEAPSIVDAFTDAVADDIAALADAASRIPVRTAPDQLTTSGPDLYAATYQATHAQARIDTATAAIAPLLGVGGVVQRRALFTTVPDIPADNIDRRVAVASAFDGQRMIRTGESVSSTATSWYAAVVALGASFVWVADAGEARERAARLSEYERIPKGHVLDAEG